MAIINSPPTTPVDTQDGEGVLRSPSEGWRAFFNAAWTICNSLTESGPTVQRPSTGLWVGRRYFDTDLGFPVWYNGTTWVDATGAAA